MTTTTTDYEARFLELAAMPGMETLRSAVHEIGPTCLVGCRGWLPLPEAERLGALVRGGKCQIILTPLGADNWCCWVDHVDGTSSNEEAPTPEAALTEALLQALPLKGGQGAQ